MSAARHRPKSFRPRRPGKARATSSARGYDAKWRAVRAAYLVAHPVCEIQRKCQGAPATQVDHVRTLADGGSRFDSRNLQAACHSCHSWKTRTFDMR
jgi:5-methylcytosine-specific restriction protein A